MLSSNPGCNGGSLKILPDLGTVPPMSSENFSHIRKIVSNIIGYKGCVSNVV